MKEIRNMPYYKRGTKTLKSGNSYCIQAISADSHEDLYIFHRIPHNNFINIHHSGIRVSASKKAVAIENIVPIQNKS